MGDHRRGRHEYVEVGMTAKKALRCVARVSSINFLS